MTTAREIAERAPEGWVLLLGALRTRLRTDTYQQGLDLVAAIGAAAEAVDHHPDLDLRYSHLDVTLVSHDVGAVTGRDLRLAGTISELAGQAGVTPRAGGLARLELALDTPDQERIRPFWAAVLGGVVTGGEVRDPDSTRPTVWFQESGGAEPRQHWHPDLWVDPSEVPARIDAAVAAGGTLVSDAQAPSFWVLADPEGNRVCLCTWQDRA